MPSRPKHTCAIPGCPTLTHERYCATHAKREQQRYEAQRGTATERGYDATWAKVQRMTLRRSPLCVRCAPRIVAAVLVHHKDRNPRNNRAENLEALCRACHEQEHREDRWGTHGGGGGIASSQPESK